MRQVVYCDIDSILDTRIGTIVKINPEAADEILSKEEYFLRNHDHEIVGLTDKVTLEDYKTMWENRDVETLMLSRPTNMLLQLSTIMMKLDKDAINTPLIDSVDLEINIYPYQLTDEEKDELKIIISTYVGALVKITIIDQKVGLIEPGYIKENYGLMIIYEFQQWLRDIFPKLQTTGVRLPDVYFMLPALYEDKEKIPTEDDETVEEGKRINAFAAMEFMFIEYLSIAFQPVIAFSFMTPELFKQYIETVKKEKEKQKEEA